MLVLVWNSLCANKLSFVTAACASEKGVTQGNNRVYLATAGIMAGCVLLVSFGNHQSQTVTVTDLMSYYQRYVLTKP